ncbi:MAG: hypothetical protein BGO78_04155 [Chloroflexi bacterium 44-23]|nr:MAG: hypothetical protein BGO78_04155 [Chloroflexi bacterium 44-23]
MKKYFYHLISFLLLLLLLSACNLPGVKSNPTPILFPTPNYTMTALFSTAVEGLTSATAPVVVVTETTAAGVAASNTPIVIVATPMPSATATTMPSATTTPIPTATNTQTIRGGFWVTAPYLKVTPVLDGVWDEWNTTKYPAKYVAYGKGEWVDSKDLEGSFRIGWDKDYLYLAVKVLDDKYVQNATGADLFKGDSIEILLDTDLYGDLNSTVLNGDDFQIGISAGKGGIGGIKEGYIWFPASKAGGISGIKIGSEGGDGVYRVEMAIPWSTFGITPASGQQYGFGLSISDNDNESKNEQQSMVSNLPNRVLTNPTTWTLLTLTN